MFRGRGRATWRGGFRGWRATWRGGFSGGGGGRGGGRGGRAGRARRRRPPTVVADGSPGAHGGRQGALLERHRASQRERLGEEERRGTVVEPWPSDPQEGVA